MQIRIFTRMTKETEVGRNVLYILDILQRQSWISQKTRESAVYLSVSCHSQEIKFS